MRKLTIVFLLFLLFWGNLLRAQSTNKAAEKSSTAIRPTGKTKKSAEFYSGQAETWNSRTRVNPADAGSWYNLYTSSRNAILAAEKKITPASQQSLDRLASEIVTKVPGTFESELVIYLNGNKDMKLLPHLLKAYEISPNRIETYPELMAWYELRGDEAGRQEFCKKLYQRKHYDERTMTYNFNVLMSVEQSAILFTSGEYDTYPAWLLQTMEGIRKDVTIINTNLIDKPDYRKKIMTAAGLQEPADVDFMADKPLYLSRLVAANPNSPVYFSMTLGRQFTQPLSSQLYVTGLAFRYSPVLFVNLPVLQENLERRFKAPPTGRETLETSNNLEGNYIIPMLLLMDYYDGISDKVKAGELKNNAIRIAEQTGQTEVVNRYINSRK